MATTVTQTRLDKYEGISGKDFDTIRDDVIPFSMSIEGLESTGKTHFGLMTAPLPIVHINFGDRSARWFLYQMDEERREQVTLYDFQAATADGWTRSEGAESLKGLSEIAKHHLEGGKLANGTIILDGGSSWWEIIQECYVAPEQEKREAGGGKRTGGLEYMQGNLIVSGVISWMKNQGAFLIVTHRKRQDWDAKGPIPGKFSAQINKKVPYLVEARLDLYKICTVCGAEECLNKQHQGRRHFGRFLKFGADTGYEGFTFENPTFPMVYQFYTGKALP